MCPPDTSITPGIEAFPTPNFSSSPDVITALQQFAHEFLYVSSSGNACTLGLKGDFSFLSLNPNDVNGRQYCAQVSGSTGFSAGATILTAQLQDGSKNIGPPAQVVIIPKGP